MNKKFTPLRFMVNLLIAAAIISSACNLFQPEPTSTVIAPETTEPNQPQPTEALQPTIPATEVSTTAPPELQFAAYKLPQVNASPLAAGLDTNPSWDEVYNTFLLSAEQVQRLQQDGFVVTPGVEKEFFAIYEKARYANVPIFVTSDALLHSYHLLFDKVLRTAETQFFIPLLRDLNQTLLQRADQVYQQLIGTAWEADALRTVAFIGVGSKLLDGNAPIPVYAQGIAQAEVDLVNSAGGILPSPLFPSLANGEDYTQYIPRGHYTRSEELSAYFRSMMWYGRMTFLLKGANPEYAKADTRAAIVFFVGRSDDLTIIQYGEVMDRVYGQDAPITTLVDETLLLSFISEAEKLPPPRILGMVIRDTDDEEETTKGMRFMGQRFVPDAYIFRQLIYRNVGTRDNRRGLPMGLDLFAAMGSERAYEILDQLGETQYENYPEQMNKVRGWLNSISQTEWTETLYNSWLYSFYPLIQSPSAGYPYFMNNQAWLDKQLNTTLGSWAELKHDTILYAKQVYAELGGGPPAPEAIPPRGYVEPVPEFFARLSALTNMTINGLSERSLLSEADRASLMRLEELSFILQTIAEKELRGEPLSEEEFHNIRFIGGELEHFVMAAADSDSEDEFARKYMDEQPQAAVIADVATDPANELGHVVLEEGVGRILNIHVLVPLIEADGSIAWQVTQGGVFSYYEFAWPAEDRLTDEKWRGMLDAGSAPAVPAWTSSFRIESGENDALRQGVASFQEEETAAFWYIDYQLENETYAGSLYAQELQQLRAEHRFEGRQLVRANYLSYDIQGDTNAVVTVQETWQGKLYPGDYPDYVDAIAERGPYTRLATYVLTFDSQNERWVVVQATFEGEVPDWVWK